MNMLVMKLSLMQLRQLCHEESLVMKLSLKVLSDENFVIELSVMKLF